MILLFGADGGEPGQAPHHLYMATAMIVNFFVVAPAVIRHRQARATTRRVVALTIPSAVIGAIVGVRVSELPVFSSHGQGYLQIGFAVFLAYVIGYNLWKLISPSRRSAEGQAGRTGLSGPLIVATVGLPTGLLGGVLGIGGGLFAVPAQQVWLRIPLRSAIANSAATILCSSLVGAVIKNYGLGDHGYGVGDSLRLAICLIPSAIVGSWYASARVHRWPLGIIRAAFVLLLLYCGQKIFLAGLAQVWQ